MKNIKRIMIERYKFYIAGYLVAYPLAALNNETINIQNLFPLNAFSVLLGLLIGTSFYYISQKTLIALVGVKSIKYVIFIVISIIALVHLDNYLLNSFGINIKPFLGF